MIADGRPRKLSAGSIQTQLAPSLKPDSLRGRSGGWNPQLAPTPSEEVTAPLSSTHREEREKQKDPHQHRGAERFFFVVC